jgi:hypothetical protein
MRATSKKGTRIGRFGCPLQLTMHPTHLDVVQVNATVFNDDPSISISSTRRFGYRDSATASVSYSQAGLGLDLTSNRQIFEGTNASLGCTLGPIEERGMTFAVRHEKEWYTLHGKVQV